jgi:hypothetical protein
MPDESASDRDQLALQQWLQEAYGSAYPSRVRTEEARRFRVPGWWFFFGSLEPAPSATFAVALHDGRVLEGQAGLAEFVRDQDLYHRPDAIALEKLAGIAMFFLSRYGAGDAMLIASPRRDGSSWRSEIRKLLHKPRMVPQDGGYLVEFWYAQRMLTRVSMRIRPDNEIECHTQPITDLLPSE